MASSYDPLNEYQVCEKGEVAVLALGDFFQLGEEAARSIEKKPAKVTLINPRFASGLDEKLLSDLKRKSSCGCDIGRWYFWRAALDIKLPVIIALPI